MRRLLFGAVSLACALGAAGPVAAQSKTAVLPFLGSAPETGFQGGLAYLRVWQPNDTMGTRPSSRMGNIVFTEKQQFRAFIESDRWTEGNERRRQWGLTLLDFPLPYNGHSVSESYQRQSIENRSAELWLTQSWQRRPNVWYSVGGRIVANSSEGNVSPPTAPCDLSGPFPSCPVPSWGPSGIDAQLRHVTVLATLGRVYDTRDRLFAPTTGRFVDLSLSVANRLEDPEGFVRFRFDARSYRPLRRSTLALQALLQSTHGEPTVDQLVVMGSSSVLRGYEMGRLRDKSQLGAQAELRGPTTLLNDRMGFVAFAGGALMAPGLSASDGAAFPSAGAGIRWLLDRRTRSTIRVDYATGSRGNSGLYVAFNEAF